MAKTRKPPALPSGTPVVRRTLALAGLGLAACSGGGTRSQPPQVVPPAPPPMVLERGDEEAREPAPVGISDAGAIEIVMPPDAAPVVERQLDSKKVEDQRHQSPPPQVAPDPRDAAKQPYRNPPPMILNRNPPPMIPDGPVRPKKH